MKIKYQFLIYILILHAFIIFFAFDYFRSQKLWFIGMELLLPFSIYAGILIYKNFLKPLELISSGINSIQDRDFSSQFRKVKSKELNRLISVFNHMIDQLRQERRIQREQHHFLEKLIHATPVGIIVLDGNGKIKRLNSAANAMLNNEGESLLGKEIKQAGTQLACILSELDIGEIRNVKINGIESYKISKSHFIDQGFHNHFIIIEELTEEILRTEKTAYGKVIRMMSHEVNNSIGAINSLVKSLRFYETEIVPVNRIDYNTALSIIAERNDNMNLFMQNFASVIRLPDPALEKCEMNRILSGLHMLHQPICKEKGIELLLKPGNDKYHFMADLHQIEQLLVNVIKNAIESIPKEGIITFIANPDNDEIRVEDTGHGISTENQKGLFSPFFSTRKNGQGIGLTLCRDIAHNHGFKISLKNRPEGGAVFTLKIPERGT